MPVEEVEAAPLFNAETLAEVPYFKGLAPAQIEELKTIATTEQFAAGDCVFNEGQTAETMHFILSGEVQLSKRYAGDKEKVLVTLGRNGAFGEIAFLLGSPRTASARAVTDTTLLTIARRAFNMLLNSNRMVAYRILYNLVLILAGRLAQTDERLEAVMAYIDERLEHGDEAFLALKALL